MEAQQSTAYWLEIACKITRTIPEIKFSGEENNIDMGEKLENKIRAFVGVSKYQDFQKNCMNKIVISSFRKFPKHIKMQFSFQIRFKI